MSIGWRQTREAALVDRVGATASSAHGLPAPGQGRFKVRVFSYENGLLAILFVTNGLVSLDRTTLTFLSPFLVRDLHLNNTELGLLAAALSLSLAFSGAALGVLADASGWRKQLLALAVVVFSCCSVLSGFAGSFVALLTARLIMGVADGPVMPIGHSLMAMASSERRRGLNLGLLQPFASAIIGVIIGPLLVITVAQAFGWRTSFFLAGAPGLITAGVILLVIRNPAPSPPLVPAGTAPARTGGDLRTALRNPNVRRCILISCAFFAWLNVQTTFLPVFLAHRGFSYMNIGVLSSSLGVAGACGSLLLPSLSDRIGRKIVMLMATVMALTVPLVLIFLSAPVLVLAASIFVGWMGNGCISLFAATIPADSLRSGRIAAVVGLIIGSGELVGGVAAPAIAGRAADVFGLDAPFWIAFGAGLLCLGFCLFLQETAPARRDRRDVPLAGAPDL